MPIPSWVGPVASAAVGWLGGERQNSINQREAQKNREFQAGEAKTNRAFQERMRNTEWQAAVADMQAAGINPAVAYSRGGASSPSGSMAGGSQAAPAENTVSSAMQAMRTRQEMALTKATIEKVTNEGRAAGAAADLAEDRRNYLLGGGSLTTPDGRTYRPAPLNRDLIDAEIARAVSEAARAGSMADITGLGAQAAGSVGRFMPAFDRIAGVAAGGADAVAGVIEFGERVARMRDEAVQRTFGVPKKTFEYITRQLERVYNRRRN